MEEILGFVFLVGMSFLFFCVTFFISNVTGIDLFALSMIISLVLSALMTGKHRTGDGYTPSYYSGSRTDTETADMFAFMSAAIFFALGIGSIVFSLIF